MKKKFLIFILIITFITGLYIGRVIASPGLPATVLEAGSLVTEASYVIFTDGTEIYARNGETGEIEFQDTDADTLINNVLNILTSGGKIFIKGNIIFETITISKSGIILSGDTAAYTRDISGTPMIRHLIFNSTNGNVDSGLVENMYIGELIIQPDNYNRIRGLSFRDVDFVISRPYNSHGVSS